MNPRGLSMKALSADSLLARLLGRLTAAVFRHPRWFIYPQVVLFVVCVLYTVGYLKTDMNRDNLVGPNHKNHENYLRLQKEFPQQGNDLVVVVESGNIEKNRQFVERIAAKMRAETNLFADVFYQQDPVGDGGKGIAVRRQGRFGRVEKEARRCPAVHPPVYADDEPDFVF